MSGELSVGGGGGKKGYQWGVSMGGYQRGGYQRGGVTREGGYQREGGISERGGGGGGLSVAEGSRANFISGGI